MSEKSPHKGQDFIPRPFKKRKKRLYLLRGVKVMALSKDEVLRGAGLSDCPKNRALVVKIKNIKNSP